MCVGGVWRLGFYLFFYSSPRSVGFFAGLGVGPWQPFGVDEALARKSLKQKPARNPVKSSAPVVERTHERRPDKGLEVEILKRADGTVEERPFVPLLLLFVVNSDQLLDNVSQANIAKMAAILLEVNNPKASFSIQGHTSAEGDAQGNQQLSERRATRIQALLAAHGVPPDILAPVGLGETVSRFPDSAPESQLRQDRAGC